MEYISVGGSIEQGMNGGVDIVTSHSFSANRTLIQPGHRVYLHTATISGPKTEVKLSMYSDYFFNRFLEMSGII